MNCGGQGAGGHFRMTRAPNRILYGGRPRGMLLKWGFDTGKRLHDNGQEGSAYNDRGGQSASVPATGMREGRGGAAAEKRGYLRGDGRRPAK